MKYVFILMLFIPPMYTYSFIKYSWNNKNKMAAVGAAILGIVSIVLPAGVMLMR